MTRQLPLALELKDSAAFESYFPGPNDEVMQHLQRLPETSGSVGVYLWGPPDTGKSHLLQAACRAAGERNLAAVYLPMRSADQFPCEALDGLENVGLVCIDDVHVIAGREEWERAIVHLLDRIQGVAGKLIVTGNTAPADLGFDLPQLCSRLTGGLVFQLRRLGEEEILRALQLRADRRGFNLPLETSRYLVRHYGRDLSALFEVLDSLDRASLAAKRKLTIPFARSVLKRPDAE